MRDEFFTQIDNKIIENLCQKNLSPYETRVLLAIIRKTFGFQKEMDYIAQSQIAKMTKLDRRLVNRAMQGLMKKGIICRDGKKIGISLKLYRKLASAEMTTAIGKDDKSSSVEMHTTDTNINIKTKGNENIDLEKNKQLIKQMWQQANESKEKRGYNYKENRNEEAEYNETIRQSKEKSRQRREEEDRASEDTINETRRKLEEAGIIRPKS